MDETTDRADPQTSERTTSVSNGGSGQGVPGLLADATQDPTGAHARGCSTPGASEGPPQGDPPAIGRYRIIRRLGQGAFGRVYLALDEDLDRLVAIKVPSPGRVADPEDVAAYLAEARNLARLDHPNIVPVHDVGRTDAGPCYVISKYVEGIDLAERTRQARLSFRESAELVAAVAEALHHAHTRGLVHRDVKPANILIDAQGKPCIADFGLALRDEDYGKGAQFAGTPAYMSPEQARGEGHRVDGRSDIFSLGVVFYELLTGRRPFRGDPQTDVLHLIAAAELRPPRQVDDTIPKELERIVLKALSKRAAERYSTAGDLAEDLRHFLQSGGVSGSSPALTQGAIPPPFGPVRPDSDGTMVKVVPKGLRSFDCNDANFFLELLPGPRDWDGLPESLRFWKTRIESTDPDATFKVGLIYGPSGCGKTSLVKAGLLPRLRGDVLPVYIEATLDETEARLLRALRRACPKLSLGLGLVESLAALRRGRILRSGQKVLLVLDQFEQWLFARRGEENTELVAALRQCDGEHVGAIVLVRDDFWLAASRFLRELEIRLLEGENSALVDLFDPLHARRVLASFGRAYGVLPERAFDLAPEHKAFLDQAVAGLAQDGKVVSVRLALFAEMVKGKPWTPATLREVGGTEGVGLTFLEETFSAATAPPEYRLHQKAVQAVLKALLPQTGTDIKGQMRSDAELLDASGYTSRPGDFDDLIRILDHELRLITPTDPEGSSAEGPTDRAEVRRYYQLTHDYLVHSLRDWLTRKQRETRRGRAELWLVERAAFWSARPQSRHLPSALEWAYIRLLTRRKDWTDPQRRMMRQARRVHGLRALSLAALITLATWGGIEGYGNLRASALVESLKAAGTADVRPIIQQLSGYRRWADPQLTRIVRESPEPSRDRLHASLALLPIDPSQVPYLETRLLLAAPGELSVLRDALRPHRANVTPTLWSALKSAKPGDQRLLTSAGTLALYDPENPRWADVGGKVAEALVTVNLIFLGTWLDALRPVRGKLTAPLATIFQDKARPETEHTLATNVLADYAAADPDLLAGLLLVSDPKAYRIFFPVAERQAEKTGPRFRAELAKTATFDWNDTAPDPSWAKPDAALVGRVKAARGLLAERFAFCQAMPLEDCLATAEALRSSGYRLVRFRPYADGPTVRVAAVWTRDTRSWRIGSGLTSEQTRQQDHKNRSEKFVLVDVAGYVATANGEPADRYAALWVERAGPDDDARMYVGATATDHAAEQERLKTVHMVPATLQAMRGSDGRMRYSGVWRKVGTTEVPPYRWNLGETKLTDELAQHAGKALIDLSVTAASLPVGTSYTAVWSGDVDFESTPSYSLDPAAHLQRCREFIAQGYRPVSLSVSRTEPDGPLAAASVWHRPMVSEQAKDELAERQARSGAAMIRLGHADEVWPLLRHSADPRLRSYLINWLSPLGVDPRALVDELDRIDSNSKAAPAAGQSVMDAILFHRETSMRRALILALGKYGSEGLSSSEREPLIGKLLELYENDPDAGIHGAAEWTLRQWKQQERLGTVQAKLTQLKDRGERRWYVNSQGQTFVLVEGPVAFRMGAPPNEPDRFNGEIPHRRVIPRSFAIDAKEVTVEQYQKFVRENPQFGLDQTALRKYSPEPNTPMIAVSWYDAAAYCNWLSQKEGLPKDQWCYLPNERGEYGKGMTIPAGGLRLMGYRLPTEAEWEYVCRAGAVTSRYYGASVGLLEHYAWYQANSADRAWPCGRLLPNDLGLFDMLGNVYEWCQERLESYTPGIDQSTDLDIIDMNKRRLLRGGTLSPPAYVRSANRSWGAPTNRTNYSGFRPAKTCP